MSRGNEGAAAVDSGIEGAVAVGNKTPPGEFFQTKVKTPEKGTKKIMREGRHEETGGPEGKGGETVCRGIDRRETTTDKPTDKRERTTDKPTDKKADPYDVTGFQDQSSRFTGYI